MKRKISALLGSGFKRFSSSFASSDKMWLTTAMAISAGEHPGPLTGERAAD
jgi:hypothetical protein